METANARISWRSLIIDNSLGLVSLFVVLILTVMFSAIGFFGFVFVLSVLPLALAMIPLSFIALLFPEPTHWRARWWFLAAFAAWAVAPLLGSWLYQALNSLGDQPAIVSDAGSFVVWTQWLWAFPFLGLYLSIGANRLTKSRTIDLTSNHVTA